MTLVPTFSFSMTVGEYSEQSAKRGALLLTSLTCTTTAPRLLRLVALSQQLPSSVTSTSRRYDTRDFSTDPISVMIPDDGAMLNGP